MNLLRRLLIGPGQERTPVPFPFNPPPSGPSST